MHKNDTEGQTDMYKHNIYIYIYIYIYTYRDRQICIHNIRRDRQIAQPRYREHMYVSYHMYVCIVSYASYALCLCIFIPVKTPEGTKAKQYKCIEILCLNHTHNHLVHNIYIHTYIYIYVMYIYTSIYISPHDTYTNTNTIHQQTNQNPHAPTLPQKKH